MPEIFKNKIDIRLEAIGGQGAHSAGKIFAEAAVLGMGYSGNHFSSFGSEKRGSPVRSFIRYRNDGREARSVAPITKPDRLVIFHENLIDHTENSCEGSHENLVVILNSSKSPGQILFPDNFSAKTIATIDGLKVSQSLKVGLNAVMLGALSRFSPEVSLEAIEESFRRFFFKLSSKVLESNIRAIREGASQVQSNSFVSRQSQIHRETMSLPTLGYENAPIGGAIINPGNTILKDLSTSRKGTIPSLNYEKCVHCGYCDMVCPDYCFVWQQMPVESVPIILPISGVVEKERKVSVPLLQGIDYRYCKGCQKCISACPTQALTLVSDHESNREKSHAPRFRVKTTTNALPVFFEHGVDDES